MRLGRPPLEGTSGIWSAVFTTVEEHFLSSSGAAATAAAAGGDDDDERIRRDGMDRSCADG